MTYFSTWDWLEAGLQCEISPVVEIQNWVFVSVSEGVIFEYVAYWLSGKVALWGAVTGPDSSFCLLYLNSCCMMCSLGSVSSCFHSLAPEIRDLWSLFLSGIEDNTCFFICTDYLHGLILDDSEEVEGRRSAATQNAFQFLLSKRNKEQ